MKRYLTERSCWILLKDEKRWRPPLFTKQTTKITLRTLLLKKTNQPKKVQKIKFAKSIVSTVSTLSLFHNCN